VSKKGDDESINQKTAKCKLFDIVIQTPVQILSCRCNPDWTSLPRYSKVLLDETATTSSSCPCGVNPKARSKNRTSQEIRDSYARVFNGLERIPSRKSSDSVSMVESSPINQATMPSLRNRDSLYERSTQFERLISGQESEIGEAPPAYDVVARSTTVR